MEPTREPLIDQSPVDTSWTVEPWRDRFLVIRHLPVPGSPMVKREVYGTGKFGAQATPFESVEVAQSVAERLNGAANSTPTTKETDK
jgi:hypothetical protein